MDLHDFQPSGDLQLCHLSVAAKHVHGYRKGMVLRGKMVWQEAAVTSDFLWFWMVLLSFYMVLVGFCRDVYGFSVPGDLRVVELRLSLAT